MKRLPCRKLFYFLGFLIFLTTSCKTPILQIGKVNMISNRNVDTRFEYEQLRSYVGLSKKELKKSRNESIEEAVDRTVKSVPGGEFMMNAKLYQVNGAYYAVEGDVWGNSKEEMKGFETGDLVQWTNNLITKKGRISGLVNSEECMVKEEGEGKSVMVKYSKLVKVKF